VDNTSSSYEFVINICGALVPSSKCQGATSACQLKPNSPSFIKSIGDPLDSTLAYNDEQLTMQLRGGDPCGTKLKRRTIIRFVCDKTFNNNNNNNNNNIRFMYESDCVYYFEWHTRLACEYDCSLMHKKNLYDLSKLTRANGTFWSVLAYSGGGGGARKSSNNYTHIVFNVCGLLMFNDTARRGDGDGDEKNSKIIEKMKEKCTGSSICAYDRSSGQAASLGQFMSDLVMYESPYDGNCYCFICIQNRVKKFRRRDCD
jgi:hypothetical protein